MTLTIKTYGRATRAMWITAVLLTAAPLAHSATGQKEATASRKCRGRNAFASRGPCDSHENGEFPRQHADI